VAEVADDAEERQLGLAGRDEVPPGAGMLFVFEGPVTARFTMQDTLVPLSIVWADDGTVVGLAEMPSCPPGTNCPTYGPDRPFTHALEAAAGTFTDAGVGVGDPFVIGE
jgi:uncharacterized membrane protein (UPF0127 family)